MELSTEAVVPSAVVSSCRNRGSSDRSLKRARISSGGHSRMLSLWSRTSLSVAIAFHSLMLEGVSAGLLLEGVAPGLLRGRFELHSEVSSTSLRRLLLEPLLAWSGDLFRRPCTSLSLSVSFSSSAWRSLRFRDVLRSRLGGLRSRLCGKSAYVASLQAVGSSR